MRAIRWLLAKLILFLDAVFPPRMLPSARERSSEAQVRIDRECASLSLYQFNACPFCIKVRRAQRRMGLKIELRDAQNDTRYAEELASQGGQRQVPCLRIAETGREGDSRVRWMYESSEIISYLESRFT